MVEKLQLFLPNMMMMMTIAFVSFEIFVDALLLLI